jgi:hypothetical protein
MDALEWTPFLGAFNSHTIFRNDSERQRSKPGSTIK